MRRNPEYHISGGGDSRRHINAAAALIPFNSGRALPSKWDHAERWITSPISSHATFKKNGPSEPVFLPDCSPSHEGGDNNAKNLIPHDCSVLVGHGSGINARSDSCMMRSSSMPSSSDSVSEDDLATDEEEARASRRDVATQMSNPPSSHGRLSFSNISSSLHENPTAAKDDVRDVQVDKEGTTASASRQSTRLGLSKAASTTATDDIPSSLKVRKNTSKFQREEAKITTWENLQKAKAEAAIRKLEMKLEKKRSASMDKITNKLRGAEMKARAMREFLPLEQAPVNSHKGFSFCIYIRICNCFVCNNT